MSQLRSAIDGESFRPGLGAGIKVQDAMGSSTVSRDSMQEELAQLRAENERLRAKHREMMELLNCKNPDKLVHDLRNVLNEMQLLRLLAKMDA